MAQLHTLITFVGRPQINRETGKTGYLTAHYEFPGHSEPVTTTSFGVALATKLKPDVVVVLGTTSSGWTVLIEDTAEASEESGACNELRIAESEQRVTQDTLNNVAGLMSVSFGSRAVPRLIPAGETYGQEIEILQVIADSVDVGDVSIDVTHGLRYFGMIGFLSAHMLRQMRHGLRVRDIWYGAFDLRRDNKRTPVLRLKGLSNVQSWVEALGRFDATGDYGIFVPLLIEDGIPKRKARWLERAAFFERTLNLQDAADELRNFRRVLDNPLPGASGLFQGLLAERIEWSKDGQLGDHQTSLAKEHLERKDYLRASIFALEALVTRECTRRKQSKPNKSYRKRVLEELVDSDRKRYPQQETPLKLLRKVRNALAHSDPEASSEYRHLLEDQDQLGRGIGNAITQILDESKG